MKFLHPKLTWREFERHCEDILFTCIDESKFRINVQYDRQIFRRAEIQVLEITNWQRSYSVKIDYNGSL